MVRIGQTDETTILSNDTKVAGGRNNTNSTNVNLNIQLVDPKAVGKNEDGFVRESSGTTTSRPAPKKNVKSGRTTSPVHQNNTTINENSGNSIGSVGGNAVIGNGNAVGGDNSTNISGSGNNINVNPKPEEEPQPQPEPDPTPTPEPEPKAKLRENNGISLAERLHNETNSDWANNKKVAGVFHEVDRRNAYSFFKEYSRRADEDYNEDTKDTMQDTFDISDVWNRISLVDTTPAMEALLEQAGNLDAEYGTKLKSTEAYIKLQREINHAKSEMLKWSSVKLGGADANKEEARQFDEAIKDMVAEIDKVIE